MYWFIFRMATTFRAMQEQNQDPGISTRSPTQVQESKPLSPSLLLFQVHYQVLGQDSNWHPYMVQVTTSWLCYRLSPPSHGFLVVPFNETFPRSRDYFSLQVLLLVHLKAQKHFSCM